MICSVITNMNGDIVNNSKNSILNSFNNIFEVPIFKKHQQTVSNSSEFLLFNTLEKNFKVHKSAIQFFHSEYFQYFFIEWRINNFTSVARKFKNLTLANISNYSIDEQEVMFALLCGALQDKEISIFLSPWTNKSERSIRYTISFLYEKFETNNRTTLLNEIKCYDLDKFIPKSLFPAGIYLSKNNH